MIRSFEDIKNTIFPVKRCQLKTVENCSEFEAFDKCKVCHGNYFLTEEKTC